MSDVVDIDPTLRALDALADDFADPGDETSGCGSMWPLLAVPSDALSPLDRDARDRHLARCARCRVAMTDAWLDVDADGAALAPTRAAIPAATALPDLPERRRRGVRALAIASIVAAAASLLVVGVPMMLGSSARHTVTPLRGASIGDDLPLELVFVVEDGARTPDVLAAVNAGLARVKDHVPSDARIAIAAAHDHDLEVVARDRAPADALAVAPLAGPAIAPAYNEVLGDADALFRDPAHRRAIVIIGAACGDWPAEQSVDSVRANGVAVVAAELGATPCGSIVRGAFVARNSFDVVATIGAAVDAAVRASGGPLDVEHRAPLDLLVLIDGHVSFMGDLVQGQRSAYDDVRRLLDEIDPHIPEHSLIRIATATGDTVTLRGRGSYPYIPLARSIIGETTSYDANFTRPRFAVALEHARHLLDAGHDRTRALLVIASGCDDKPDEHAERRRQFEALRADGVRLAVVEYQPWTGLDAPCADALGADLPGTRTTGHASAIAGLVFDAVEDFSRPDPATAPADLLHFVHDTLSAP